jgi:hypothetical protein
METAYQIASDRFDPTAPHEVIQEEADKVYSEELQQMRTNFSARVHSVASVRHLPYDKLRDKLVKKIGAWSFSDMDYTQLCKAYDLTNDMLTVNNGVHKL